MTADRGANSLDLPVRHQLRNIAVYVASMWLIYLAAPVLYVGITHAALCNALGASAAVANLPNSASFWMTALPIAIAWKFSGIRALKPVLTGCYLMCVLGGLAVTASLLVPLSSSARIAAVILYGALIGGSQATLAVFLWDMLNHGVDASRRGVAFALAFGVGPLFAVIGSLLTQLTLAGTLTFPLPGSSSWWEIHSVHIATLDFPNNFACVFGASVPLMLVGAVLAGFYVVPTHRWQTTAQPFFASLHQGVSGVLSDRILLVAMIAYLAICGGGTIVNNMSLFTTEAVGRLPEELAGLQNALRFGFKSIVGLLVGWLIIRTHAKMGMLMTSGLGLLGILWILLLPPKWFLVSFGLMGATDLYAIYYPNYMLQRLRPEKVRMTMALVSLLSISASFAPAFFGAISDRFGFPASFAVAACFVGGSFLIVLILLPARVTPPTSPLQDRVPGTLSFASETSMAEAPEGQLT